MIIRMIRMTTNKIMDKHKNYIEIKYEDINENLIDISKFLGSENNKGAIDEIIKKAPII